MQLINCTCGLYDMCKVLINDLPCICTYGVVTKCLTVVEYVSYPLIAPLSVIFFIVACCLAVTCSNKRYEQQQEVSDLPPKYSA